MTIFLDSSIFCTDFYQKGTDFALLQNYLSNGNHLCLSEIVVAEVKNKYHEKILAQRQRTNKELKEMSKLADSSVTEIMDDFINNAETKYSVFWDGHLYGGGSVEGYPTLTHEEVVTRALARKKPFSADGKNGYRDYLIWNSFLEHAKHYSSETMCFITLNTKDFSDGENLKELHADLKADLASLGIKYDRVLYFTSLREFIEQEVKPHLKKLEEEELLKKEFLADTDGFMRLLNDDFINNLHGTDLSEYEVLLEIGEGENPSVSSVGDIDEIEILEISESSDNEYLIEIEGSAVCSIEFYIFKSDLIAMGDDYEVSIIDGDWNRHYALAETEADLTTTIEVIYNKKQKKIITFDIVDIRGPTSGCIYCPEWNENEE